MPMRSMTRLERSFNGTVNATISSSVNFSNPNRKDASAASDAYP